MASKPLGAKVAGRRRTAPIKKGPTLRPAPARGRTVVRPRKTRAANLPYLNNAFTRPREVGVTAGSDQRKYWMREFSVSAT